MAIESKTKVKPAVKKTPGAKKKAPVRKKRVPKKVTPVVETVAVEADITAEAVIKSTSEILREDRQAAMERQFESAETRKAEEKMIMGTTLFVIIIVVAFSIWTLSYAGIL